MKKILTLLLLIFFTFSCKKENENPLVGTWWSFYVFDGKITYGSMGIESYGALTFKNDYTGYVDLDDSLDNFEYLLSIQDTLTITFLFDYIPDFSPTYNWGYELDDDILTIHKVIASDSDTIFDRIDTYEKQ